MKIAVNTRLLIPNKLDGIGWFTYETLKRITQNHREHQFYFMFDRKIPEEFIFSDNITPVKCYPPARHQYLWYLFFEYGIPYQLNKIKPDIFVSTDGWLSMKTKLKTVNVIHDLNFEHFPEFIPKDMLRYYKKYFPIFAEKATRLATVSEYSKQDIHKTYNIPLEKIDVVYNGSNELYHSIDESIKETVRKRFTKGAEYFLFVGAIHKRKNLDNVFKAFDEFKKHSNSNVKFVVVGSKMWWKGDIEDSYEAMQFKDDVIFLGHVSTEDLQLLIPSSLSLVYASLFEGFGIPIIEAFYAETAVITSNVTSMPEVAGDAATLVNPRSINEISQAMIRIFNEPEYRTMLIEKGRDRRKQFSWDKTAEKLWNTIETTLQQ